MKFRVLHRMAIFILSAEVKSEVIRRFKVNLEEWNTQLMDIATKKKRNGTFSVTYIYVV